MRHCGAGAGGNFLPRCRAFWTSVIRRMHKQQGQRSHGAAILNAGRHRMMMMKRGPWQGEMLGVAGIKGIIMPAQKSSHVKTLRLEVICPWRHNSSTSRQPYTIVQQTPQTTNHTTSPGTQLLPFRPLYPLRLSFSLHPNPLPLTSSPHARLSASRSIYYIRCVMNYHMLHALPLL